MNIGLGAIALLASLGISGCWPFDPDTDSGKPPPPTSYTEPISPENTLQRLIDIYQARDSVAAEALYDPSYTGESTDFRDPPGSQVLNFVRADEVTHIGGLRRSPTIGNVQVDLGSPPSWQRQSSDDLAHPEWAVIQISNSFIKIFDGQTIYEAVSEPGDIQTFRFEPNPNTSSPTDTFWTIVHWSEIRGAIP